MHGQIKPRNEHSGERLNSSARVRISFCYDAGDGDNENTADCRFEA